MKKKYIKVLCCIIFLVLFLLFGNYIEDKPYILDAPSYDYSFYAGVLFCFLLEGYLFLLNDLSDIFRIFFKRKKKDPT